MTNPNLVAATSPLPRIGILGAGKVGTALARQAMKVGYDVMVATGKPPDDIELIVQITTPGAKAVSAATLAEQSDIIVVAVPLRKFRSLSPGHLAGKIVIDVMNYWPPTDGVMAEFETGRASSEIVQAYLKGARVVRTLNHVGYHEVEEDALPAGHPDRRGVAIAGDDAAARAEVSQFVDRLGFDPVDVGTLPAARLFNIGSEIFSRRQTRHEIVRLVEASRAAWMA